MSRKYVPSPGDHNVSIEIEGRTYKGTYQVKSGVLSLWTTGPDGTFAGPMAELLRGTPEEAVARRLLRDFVAGRG